MPELFIDGEWKEASDGNHRRINCPADGALVAEVSEATPDDATAAVRAARRAFDTGLWALTPATDRAMLLSQVADRLQQEKETVARLEALDTGRIIAETRIDVDDVTAVFRYYSTLAAADAGRIVDTGMPDVVSKVVYEPIGVCSLITPWNYPLLQTSWKVAPALAAGNSFVLKPSELTPSTAIWLLATLEELGLPAGVGNLILGAGGRVGPPLTESPEVDLVSFTGGLVTGRSIAASAAPTVKKVALELGGKNPNVVFADADFEAAVDGAMNAVFYTSGEVCSAGTRLIIEESIHDEFVAELVKRTEAIKIGGPFDENAETGPLISAAHRDKVEKYVDAGIAEGAKLLVGGRRPEGEKYANGYYYLPTILDGCSTEMSCVQDESFGPVITVETFSGHTRDEAESEALRIANDTVYGLAGAVWSQDGGRGERVAARLRHGTIWINDFGPYVPGAEWGGFKQSGVGRELGQQGLDEYRETKHIWRNTRPAPTHWFGAENEGGQL